MYVVCLSSLALALFLLLSAAIVRHKANDGTCSLCAVSVHGLSAIQHCLEWYRLYRAAYSLIHSSTEVSIRPTDSLNS